MCYVLWVMFNYRMDGMEWKNSPASTEKLKFCGFLVRGQLTN